MSKCIGCGIKLQNENINALGYTKKLDNLYCERCFKTIHYNKEIKVSNQDNYQIVDKINKLGLFTIFITDILHLNEELIKLFKSFNNKKVLVINKSDIIPKNLKLEHLTLNIKESYNINNDIFFISAKSKNNINKIIKLIEENKKVILCGETSSGKSTLINSLTDSLLTTSKYNNTTLDFIKIKYLDYIIYDSPGFIVSNFKNVEKYRLLTKTLNSKYIYDIGGIKITGDGNITLFLPHDYLLSSKKDNSSLKYELDIKSVSDIILPNGGFIFIKNNMKLKVSQELEIRKSIIGR